MYIGYNKYQRYGKIILIILLVLPAWGMIAKLPPDDFSLDIFILLIVLIIIVGEIFMLMQLLFLPSGVEIDNDNKALTVHYFLIKPNTIGLEDILDYSTTKIFTKSTEYGGVLVHTKRGRKYLFDDFNIADYKPIKDFLDTCQVSFAGHEKFSNVSYFTAYFKYK
jgi:hypothetical protein